MLKIGGFQPFTTVDFPSRLAAVLFLRGCPLRCPYCHNAELQQIDGEEYISWNDFIEFLKHRKKLIDGVVFSGGEPLIQKDLFLAIEQVKNMGYEIGLHTSGVSDKVLSEILPMLTWVGFDCKTLFSQYKRIPNANGLIAEKCLDLLIASGIEFECRTTLDPRVIGVDELVELAKYLAGKGVHTFALQEFRPTSFDTEAPALTERTAYFSSDIIEELKKFFPNLIIRRA